MLILMPNNNTQHLFLVQIYNRTKIAKKPRGSLKSIDSFFSGDKSIEYLGYYFIHSVYQDCPYFPVKTDDS